MVYIEFKVFYRKFEPKCEITILIVATVVGKIII
jgi:hypothetical protein